MTVFKPQSTAVGGTGAGATDHVFEIRFGPEAPISQSAFMIGDYLAAPIWFVARRSNGAVQVWGDYLSAWSDIVSGSFVGVDGARNPPCAHWPDGGASQGLRLWSGTGAPSATTIGGAAAIGDLYFRRDTPSTNNQRIYQCTTAGTPGTWTARL